MKRAALRQLNLQNRYSKDIPYVLHIAAAMKYRMP